MGQKTKAKKEWREFEQLVARIEKAFASKGVVVKSPDHIRSLPNGQMREVDASIRFKIGTVPILITVECRKRKDKEDILWIEQLVTKKQSISASKTIAVSSSGFSQAAIDKASTENIEVRVVAKISEDDIRSWIHLDKFWVHELTSRIKGADIKLLPIAGYTTGPDTTPLLEDLWPIDKHFVKENGDLCSLDDLLQDVYPKWLQDFYAGTIPFRFQATFVPPAGTKLRMKTGADREVTKIDLDMEFEVKQKFVPASAFDSFQYADPTAGRLAEGSETIINVFGNDMLISFHHETNAPDVKVTFTQKQAFEGSIKGPFMVTDVPDDLIQKYKEPK